MNAPDELPYTLTFDEEHGAYDPRWYCRICGASGVDERAHGDEDSAMTAALVQEEPIAMRLTTAPGVGPVTASAFVATIDDITRFHSAHELEAYLGVIPSERSSGWLLVEAAWQILRSKSPQTLALRTWTLTIAQRRGKRIAVVALARRLAGILYAMWRDGVPHDAQQIRPRLKEAPPRAA